MMVRTRGTVIKLSRMNQAQSLISAIQVISSARDIASLAISVCRTVRTLINSEGATFVLREGDHCVYLDEDAVGPLWKGRSFPLNACAAGWTILNNQIAQIPDIYADLRIPFSIYRPTFVQGLCTIPFGHPQSLGTIGCYWSSHHQASEDELQILNALAGAVTTGLANVEAFHCLDEINQKAQEEVQATYALANLFMNTFEHAAIGIAHVSPEGNWLHVNQKLCDIIGYSHEALLDLTFQDITYAEDLDADLELMHKVLNNEIQSYEMEKRYVHREGHLIWANLTVSIVRKSDGSPDYFVSMIEDIDKRKHIEEILEEERAVFRSLANIAVEFFWELDEEFRFKEISLSITDRSGLDYKSFMGKTRWELPFVGVSEADWAKHKSLLASHKPFRDFQGGLPDLNGKTRWFSISGDPVFRKDGTFKGYRGVTQDITERRHIEQRLHQHGMVFASSQEGIVITDPTGAVIDANPSFERITEYSLEELRGENLRMIQSGRHDRNFFLNMWGSIKTTGHWQGEIWNRRKSGEIYQEWISITAVKDKVGKVIAYVGTSIDINRIDHAQTELERLAHHDALTDLPNRLLLTSRLEHAVERACRYHTTGVVMFLDLDDFKCVNDTYGHAAGDELLISVASRLTSRLREVDTLSRFGGDEFVVVLEEVQATEDVQSLAQELIDQISMPFILSSGIEVVIGTSIGIATFPQNSQIVPQLLECADQALYEAKKAGRGVLRFFGAH